MSPKVWAIPGFLGLPTDWNFLHWESLQSVKLNHFSWISLPDWAKKFNQYTSLQEKPAILMGYSLGGRLALHALLDQPQQWQGAILISTHPGLSEEQEREKRWQKDQKWADRFKQEEWGSLMQAWNAQEVFSKDHFHFNRQENDYQRLELAHTIIQGSLAKQADLRQQIATLSLPILWVTGSLDQRYCQLAQTLTFAHSQSSWKKIPEAGHRAPWIQPQAFSKTVKKFIENLIVSKNL